MVDPAEQLLETVSVHTRLVDGVEQSPEYLREQWQKGEVLCWTFSPNSWRINLWFRNNIPETEWDSKGLKHLQVDAESKWSGTYGLIGSSSFTIDKPAGGSAAVNELSPVPVDAVKKAIVKFLGL